MKRGLLAGLSVSLCLLASGALVAATVYLNGFSAVVSIADTDNTFWCQISGGCASTDPLKRVTAAQIKAYIAASLALTGTPTTPTAAAGTNTTQVASTAFVQTATIGSRTAHGDSAYNILTTDRYVVTSTSLTAARTWTLPAASSLPAGTQVVVEDEAGGATSTNTLAIAPNGTNTINGGNNANSSTIGVAYGGYMLRTDGSSKWSVVANTILQACSAPSNNFMIGIGASGACLFAQPAFSNISGTATAGQLPVATTGAFGAVKPDGSTITISGGVISSVGGAATDVAVGTTTVSGTCPTGQNLYNNGGVVGCQANGAGGSGIGTKIATCALASTTCNFNSLGSHDYYALKCSGVTVSSAGANVILQFNGDTTSGHYNWHQTYQSGGTTSGAGSDSGETSIVVVGSVATTDVVNTDLWFENIASTTLQKTARYHSYSATTSAGTASEGGGAFNQSAAAITSVQFTTSAGTFGSGANKCTLYAYDS